MIIVALAVSVVLLAVAVALVVDGVRVGRAAARMPDGSDRGDEHLRSARLAFTGSMVAMVAAAIAGVAGILS